MGKTTRASFIDSRNISPAAAKAATDNLLEHLESGTNGSRHAVELVIGPDEAEFLLSLNPKNRNLRPVKVAQFVKDMRHGRWISNGESIIVASTGELNDGQHRLAAVTVAKIPQKFMVAFGYPRESRYSVDTGAARTAGDHLAMAGASYSNQSAAAARLVISYEQNGGRIIGRQQSVTSLEIQERVKSDELLHEAVIYCEKHRIPFVRMSVISFAFYVLARVAPRHARQYMDGVLTGINLTASDPAYIVRDRIMRSDAKLSTGELIELVFRGWNYFAKGKVAPKNIKLHKGEALPVLQTPHASLLTDEEETTESIVPYSTTRELVDA